MIECITHQTIDQAQILALNARKYYDCSAIMRNRGKGVKTQREN